jgi:RNA polymerase sigma-70 factor, ECF subfamily
VKKQTSSDINSRVEAIWTDLHGELKKFIQGKVNDTGLAGDILQGVFLKIQLNLHTLSDASKLTAWVYQITRNHIADHYREMHRNHWVELPDLAANDEDEPLYHALSNCINQKIERLPEKYRQAILHTYFHRHRQKSLASKWRLSYTGTKSRVQRGRQKLKQLILQCKNLETGKKGNPLAYTKRQK